MPLLESIQFGTAWYTQEDAMASKGQLYSLAVRGRGVVKCPYVGPQIPRTSRLRMSTRIAILHARILRQSYQPYADPYVSMAERMRKRAGVLPTLG